AHDTDAAVPGREPRFHFVDVNWAAASAAWPRITRFVTSLRVSFAVNWIHAAVIVAPLGTVNVAPRMPPTWSVESWISSTSLLLSDMVESAACSASSLDAETRASNVRAEATPAETSSPRQARKNAPRRKMRGRLAQ